MHLFFSFIGLNHEQNMKKMRLLTFMQLAETNPEMSFDTIQEELQINESEVESFIIDGKLSLCYLIIAYIYYFNICRKCILLLSMIIVSCLHNNFH